MEVSDKERLRWRDEDTDKDTDHTQEPRDEPGLPIMHWEALSLRIAELEKQEEEKKDKLAKSGAASLERGRAPVSCTDDQGCGRRESWEDGRRRHRRHLDRRDGLDRSDDSEDLSALGSRLQTQMNLQLCFINNSESDDEEQEEEEEEREERDASAAVNVGGNRNTRRKPTQARGQHANSTEGGQSRDQTHDLCTRGSVVAGHKTATPAAKTEKNKSRGFRSTWRKLRERLRADHKPANPPAADPPLRGRRLEHGDVHKLSLGELHAQRSFLTQTVQKLSSDLVAGLQVRDQLRTEQDAMLLELQDLTSLHN